MTAFSRTFSNFSILLWCHLMWDGKLSLYFEFQYPNSFGRWKFLHRVHFSILNCTRQLFLRRFQTFSKFLWYHLLWNGKLSICFEIQYPNSFGRWKYLRRVHFSILNCTRLLFLGCFQTFSKFLWCHLLWNGKLSLCFEFQYPNSLGRWKYLRRVHFSILNCTQQLFLGRL